MTRDVAGIAGVADVEVVAGSRATPEGGESLLIEVPHGATRESDYDALRRRLHSDLDDELKAFFFVNTDIGAFEVARRVAELFVRDRPRRALIVRGLVPRTFTDLNRIAGTGGENYREHGVTPATPDYVTAAEDRTLLAELHERYQELAERAFARVCGAGGIALTLHTYAPRSVQIEHIDAGIVAALRRAYEPGTYERWPPRPEVDLITETSDGENLAPPALVRRVKAAYAAIGIEVAENASYRLHPATLGHRHSARHPGRVLCLELRRDLLADPFVPFVAVRIGEAGVERMAAPLAAALLDSWA